MPATWGHSKEPPSAQEPSHCPQGGLPSWNLPLEGMAGIADPAWRGLCHLGPPQGLVGLVFGKIAPFTTCRSTQAGVSSGVEHCLSHTCLTGKARRLSWTELIQGINFSSVFMPESRDRVGS